MEYASRATSLRVVFESINERTLVVVTKQARRDLILPTQAGWNILMCQNHENRVWQVPGVHLRRQAHPHVHNHVPDKFQFFTSPHATDPVPPVPDCFTRAVKIVWAEPFFSNVCEKKQAQLIQLGSRRARTRTVGWRADYDPFRGNHLCGETASPRKVSKLSRSIAFVIDSRQATPYKHRYQANFLHFHFPSCGAVVKIPKITPGQHAQHALTARPVSHPNHQ